jgi:hypothetical protein
MALSGISFRDIFLEKLRFYLANKEKPKPHEKLFIAQLALVRSVGIIIRWGMNAIENSAPQHLFDCGVRL